MKVVVNKLENSSKQNPYPYIGQFKNGEVVLFVSANKGTVLANPQYIRKIGDYSETWIEFNATPLQGSVTLSND